MPDPKPPEDHRARVADTFDSLHAQVGTRLDAAGREALSKIRSAASSKDTAALKAHLDELRERHGWLYNELAAHPKIAVLLDELALMGL
jgi:hypothetical protein